MKGTVRTVGHAYPCRKLLILTSSNKCFITLYISILFSEFALMQTAKVCSQTYQPKGQRVKLRIRMCRKILRGDVHNKHC